MTTRTAGSLTQTDTAMGRTVTATGRLIGLVGISGRVHLTLEVSGDAAVEVAPKGAAPPA